MQTKTTFLFNEKFSEIYFTTVGRINASVTFSLIFKLVIDVAITFVNPTIFRKCFSLVHLVALKRADWLMYSKVEKITWSWCTW